MTDMIVSGGVIEQFYLEIYGDPNGTYIENGTFNGKPKYTKSGTSWEISWGFDDEYDDFCWKIHPAGSSFFYCGQNVATPDLCSSWGYSFRATTAPTVTAASSGTTHEGEVALSSLSYLRTKKA